ncbi:hypothetical protein K3495_g12140 [Podosphaera aphanis]|nr:hypothetical protein K3495_g12140 [Podosphaera aphanis]
MTTKERFTIGMRVWNEIFKRQNNWYPAKEYDQKQKDEQLPQSNTRNQIAFEEFSPWNYHSKEDENGGVHQEVPMSGKSTGSHLFTKPSIMAESYTGTKCHEKVIATESRPDASTK